MRRRTRKSAAGRGRAEDDYGFILRVAQGRHGEQRGKKKRDCPMLAETFRRVRALDGACLINKIPHDDLSLSETCSTRFLNGAPDSLARDRQLEVRHAELGKRVDHRIAKRRKRRRGAALPAAAYPERIGG